MIFFHSNSNLHVWFLKWSFVKHLIDRNLSMKVFIDLSRMKQFTKKQQKCWYDESLKY